jgi:hypothetical protein
VRDDLLAELQARPIGSSYEQMHRGMYQNILLLDIETYPALTWQWTLWDKFTPVERVVREGGLLSWAAKWYAEEDVAFGAAWEDGTGISMAERLHELMCQADVVVTYNGNGFDLPWLRQAIELESGLGPVSPFVSVDLFQTVRQFKFLSKKLDYVVQKLDLGQKVKHEGFSLWVSAMPESLGGKGDPDAQDRMRRYNVGDVADTLEPLYDALLPWTKHPHVALYTEDGLSRCGRCGSLRLTEHGRAYTPLGVFRRYRCEDCRSWHRGKSRLETTDIRPVGGRA